jgi:hypothetical protein
MTLGVYGELHPRAPAEVRIDRLDIPCPLDVSESLELLAYDIAEQRPLHRGVDVLEVASATLARIRARRRDTPRCGLDDLDGVGAKERLGSLSDLDANPLTRQRMPYEHDLPIDTGDAVTSVSNRADVNDDVLHG